MFTLKKGWLYRTGLNVGFRIDNIAFRPHVSGQLATAGGPNQEVRLWDYRKGTALDTIQSPGSTLWNVTISKDGKYLGWKDQLNPDPQNPNDRGTGPWRVFPLLGGKRSILSSAPDDFKPRKPLRSWGGWSVDVSGKNGFLWKVRNPSGEFIPLDAKSKLYFPRVAQLPRAMLSFLRRRIENPAPFSDRPSMGSHIYELRDGAVRLVRVLMGHEAEVTSLILR